MNASERERQLATRLERERSARRQAEVIAERGMRELWDANRLLQDRIGARTEQIERVFDGAERAVGAWADELDAAATRVRAAVERGGDHHAILEEVRHLDRVIDLGRRSIATRHTAASPSVVADELLARWQHRAARRGQLLTVLSDRDEVTSGDWVGVVAVAEVLVGAAVLYGGPGVLEVDIRTDEPSIELSLLVRPGTTPPRPGGERDREAEAARSLEIALAVARRLVDGPDADVRVTIGDDWHVVARFPVD